MKNARKYELTIIGLPTIELTEMTVDSAAEDWKAKTTQPERKPFIRFSRHVLVTSESDQED